MLPTNTYITVNARCRNLSTRQRNKSSDLPYRAMYKHKQINGYFLQKKINIFSHNYK